MAFKDVKKKKLKCSCKYSYKIVPYQIQTKFLHMLYMDSISVEFEKNIIFG